MKTSSLKYPVNFVIPHEHLWEEVRQDAIDKIDEEKLSRYAVDGKNCWIGRTYFHLAKAGYDVSHSPVSRRDVINVVSARDFGRRDRNPDDFILIPRADSHRPMLANFTLTQCAAAPTDLATSYMSHWPQANIRPRNHLARPKIERLCYKGRLSNLDAAFRSQDFIDRLSEIGVTLVLDAFDGITGDQDWGDYSDSDVTFAVRNLTYQDALHKPPSKLVNAWFGETPAILGPEPAFRSIRTSELDYMEVRTPEAVVTAVRNLRETPKLYEEMIKHGRKRRKAFTVNQLTLDWVYILNEKVGPLFESWQRKSRLEKRMRWASMMVSEPISKRQYYRYIRRGRRILAIE